MDYWVSYCILDRNGVTLGQGATKRDNFIVPRTASEVRQLSGRMTDDQRRDGLIGSTNCLSVVSWSEMGR